MYEQRKYFSFILIVYYVINICRKQTLQGMMIHKTIHGKLKIMQREPHNSCATEV